MNSMDGYAKYQSDNLRFDKEMSVIDTSEDESQRKSYADEPYILRHTARRKRGLLGRAGIWLIRWYQRNISARTPPSCRFYPTCSQYTIQAIERFGMPVGCLLGAWRILRCNPFVPGGWDPVPERKARPAERMAEHLRNRKPFTKKMPTAP